MHVQILSHSFLECQPLTSQTQALKCNFGPTQMFIRSFKQPVVSNQLFFLGRKKVPLKNPLPVMNDTLFLS